MGDIQLVPSQLAGIVVESLLYGVFLILFVACIYVLLYRRRDAPYAGRPRLAMSVTNRVMLFASVCLFCSITAHWLIDVVRLFNAFVYYHGPMGAFGYYAKLADVTNVAKTGFVTITSFTGDCILVYRLYLVWGRNKLVIIFPVCTALGLLIGGFGTTYEFSRVQPGQDVFLSVSGRWITSSFIFTIATNLYSTPMIAYRIWSGNRHAKKLGSLSLTPVIFIVVESAAIYTIWIFITFIAFEVKSNLQSPGMDTASPLIGIVFCLIIVRVGLGLGSHPRAGEPLVSRAFAATSNPDRSRTAVSFSAGTRFSTRASRTLEGSDSAERQYELRSPKDDDVSRTSEADVGLAV